MNRSDYARLKDIVAGALARPATDRVGYVNARCGPDVTARLEAQSLLAAALEAADLYEDPTLSVAGARVTLDALAHVDAAALPLTPLTLHADPAAGLPPCEFEGTSRYRVRRRIGTGGMGIVYEVDDRDRQQVVALKSLRRRSGDDIYQLKREFRNVADVAHPNLVSLYDLVVDDAHCFFTMELIEGLPFVDYVRQPTTVPAAQHLRHVLPQLVAALEQLHRRGLQHRDIKPSNVLVTPAGRVVVLDFGLTSTLLREDAGAEGIAGTPAYLSPEQCRGGVATSAADWYAVGVMLYHALTGRLPIDGPIRHLIARKISEDPPPISAVAPDTPADLQDACMALLRRDPAARPTGRQALDRLQSAPGEAGPSNRAAAPEPLFVGRESSLNLLAAAFADAAAGRGTSVVIHGPSGIGKSTLVQHFLERRLTRQPVLVLRSRCHEHESIPYKGLDGIVDSITGHLSALPAADAARLLPPGAPALARLFPVLRALGVEPAPDGPDEDPLTLRRTAFAAFRDLLARLGRRRPVILDIDDFHWADADSVRWLTDLLHPPSPPSLLTIVSFRSEELDAKPFLRSLIERVDLGARLTIPLAPMSADEIARLVEAVRAAGPSPVPPPELAAIVSGSAGNPFLVDVLARNVSPGPQVGSQATLAEMVARRLDALPREACPFLEALAVCGRPMLPAHVFEACGFAGDERPLVARLRAAHLVRSSRAGDRIEVYHDRIRESVAAAVSADAARRIHDAMARAAVAHGDDDPESLFDHYRAAGHTAAAATQAAAAAARANNVLAFDLAATFFRYALEMQPDDERSGRWRVELARALENAGRPVDAAESYLAAASAPQADRLECRRKAAELLLVGGRIDDGLRVIGDVLRTVGVRLARGPSTALVSLVFRRLQLRWLGFRPVKGRPGAAEDLLRIDACWSLTVGMAMVDPLRAADFNVRQLLWALRVGDPYRVARALALEAGFSVIVPVGTEQRPADLFGRAAALAEGEGRHYVIALTALWQGIGAFLTGRWMDASRHCGQAATTFRDHCTGVTWELNLAQNFYLFSLVYRGELREAAGHLPSLLDSARQRGNAYLELELATRMSLVSLAADQPLDAERRANESIARWKQDGFQRPHYHHLLTLLQVRLYRGQPGEAWELIARHEARLRQSHFRRVQHTRVEMANYRARCALALAAAGEDARGMREIAAREGGVILRENVAWATPFARLISATIAHQEGRLSAAAGHLAEAANGFRAADMHLHAAVCRHRLGAHGGGHQGLRLRVDAEGWMGGQDVRNPTAMARLIAPGFPD